MHLAARALSISGSATLELTAKVAELRRQGVDVVSFGAGEPDFPCPPAAIEAATAFIAKGRVLYTAATGLPELREAAAAELLRDTGVRYEPRQVCITNGAKEGSRSRSSPWRRTRATRSCCRRPRGSATSRWSPSPARGWSRCPAATRPASS